MKKVDFDVPECLAVNPFDGDFGDPGDHTFKDRITTARKPHVCHLCVGPIEKGDTIRLLVEKSRGKLRAYRWCAHCCAAMAASWNDEGKLLSRRFGLHDTPAHLWADHDTLDVLMSYADGMARAMRVSGLTAEHIKELALSKNVEKCPSCGWWVESSELLDYDGDEPDGYCCNCRYKKESL